MLKNRPRLTGTLLGLAVTALATTTAFRASLLRKLELQTYDYRIRLCNTLRPDPRIVHIDIDDGSLERIGRWPWPRIRLADLVRELHALHAKYIIVDLLLSEREPEYLDTPALGRDSDIEPPPPVLGLPSEENIVRGDLELAHAIRTAGRVVMATQLDARAPDQPAPLADALRRLYRREPDLSIPRALQALRLENTPENAAAVGREWLRRRIADLLIREFTLTDAELARRLDVPSDRVEAVVAGVKREVAADLVARLFQTGARPSFAEVCAALLGPAADRRNADRHDVARAYRARLGLLELDKHLYPLDPERRSPLHRARDVVPLYFEFARAARDIAAVNFTHDADHGVRRVPIVFDHRGRAILHLGFAAAARILDLDPDRMTFPDPRTLLVPRRDAQLPLRVPLDGHGNLIIPWTRTGHEWRRNADFPHIPAAKILALADARRRIRENEIQIAYHLADVVAASKGAVRRVTDSAPADLPADQAYRARVREELALRRRIRLAELRNSPDTGALALLRRRADELHAAIEQDRTLALSHVRMMCGQLDEIPPDEIAADPELRETAARFRRARRLIREDIPALRRANRALEGTIEDLRSRLAEPIDGRFVFLGYAATAQGDIVPTPIDDRTHGVMCHANILNAFLQNHFISRARPSLEITVCLLLGAAISLLTATREPRLALLLSLTLLVAYALFNALVLFRAAHHWFSLVPVVFTGFLAWAFVTLFRQLTAERDKRLFRKQLSQYTSPAIAARIAESPAAAAAFKAVQTRDVTCFFSDLRGFTAITEQQDAEVVRRVLNTYLECMCRVIWNRRGLINKFMGDGIMAFFNPSVDPLPDHPRVACETALEAFEELERLKTERARDPDAGIFARLEMRIGLATGLCKNGDLGSELKADYTVIGDVVNLAARLEPANKVFGTRILVSGPLHDAVKDAYEFRYLAELQVKGKRRTVPAWEIICRKGEMTDDQRAWAERFEAGARLYQQRRWDECIVHFTRMLARRPDDLAASRYIDACQELKTFPPDDNWSGALELKEK